MFTRYIFFIISFLFSVGNLVSQVKFESLNIDFGELKSDSDRFVDLKISNIGSRKEYILRVVKTEGVTTLLTQSNIEKDSSILLRIHVNPSKLGTFKYKLPLYTSDKLEETILTITGYQQEFVSSSNQHLMSCPSFGQRSSNSNLNFNVEVTVIDATTKKIIPNANVSLLNNGMKLGTFKMPKNTAIISKANLGYIYAFAYKDGYLSNEVGQYVNYSNNRLTISLLKNDLEKDEEILSVENSESNQKNNTMVEEAREEIETVVFTDPEIEAELLGTKDSIDIPTLVYSDYSRLEEIPLDNFDKKYFKDINIIFVLDISSSMRNNEKFDLMKFSLFQLIDLLRPNDKIGIVTYASKAKVLIAPTTGLEKQQLKDEVQKLTASGTTAGGEGIVLGYEQLLANYTEDGANQIVIITDGGFNNKTLDYKKFIKKQLKKNITLSVVGVKNSANDELSMRELAKFGKGEYVPIFKYTDAEQNLVKEIKRNSYRK